MRPPVKRMNKAQLEWLAGYLEGEGCFVWSQTSPRIQVTTTDKDVAEKVAALMGATVVGPLGPYPNKFKNQKPIYTLSKAGREAADIMDAILPSMGERRRKKINSILEKWGYWVPRPHGGWGESRIVGIAKCHPGKKHFGLGLCKECYMRSYRSQRKTGENIEAAN